MTPFTVTLTQDYKGLPEGSVFEVTKVSSKGTRYSGLHCSMGGSVTVSVPSRLCSRSLASATPLSPLPNVSLTGEVALGSNEIQSLHTFWRQHVNCGGIGGRGRFSIKMVSITGIGPTITVTCRECHTEEDISDLSSW